MGKGERGVMAREMGMEERRGEQEKGVERGEESGVKLCGRREGAGGTWKMVRGKGWIGRREMGVEGGEGSGVKLSGRRELWRRDDPKNSL